MAIVHYHFIVFVENYVTYLPGFCFMCVLPPFFKRGRELFCSKSREPTPLPLLKKGGKTHIKQKPGRYVT
jgi:hypothetical protein